jgi:hypothetical protein
LHLTLIADGEERGDRRRVSRVEHEYLPSAHCQ